MSRHGLRQNMAVLAAHRIAKAELPIARELGVTATGLRVLAKACLHPEGLAKSGGSAKQALARAGHLDAIEVPGGWFDYHVNDKGRALVARAREMGW